MDHIQNNLVVTKSNWLVEASYRLDLDEQRLLLAAISKINSREAIPDELAISAEEFASMFKLDMKNAYRQLEGAADDLYERDIKVHDETNKRRRRMRWVSEVVYHDGEGKVTLTFSQRVKRYISEIKSHYTSYKLNQVAGLRSVYSIRLYEMMQQMIQNEERVGWRVIELAWLRVYLELDDKYPTFKSINQHVIKPAVAELNKSTNMSIAYETVKKGRSVHALKFHFAEDDQQKLPFDWND